MPSPSYLLHRKHDHSDDMDQYKDAQISPRMYYDEDDGDDDSDLPSEFGMDTGVDDIKKFASRLLSPLIAFLPMCSSPLRADPVFRAVGACLRACAERAPDEFVDTVEKTLNEALMKQQSSVPQPDSKSGDNDGNGRVRDGDGDGSIRNDDKSMTSAIYLLGLAADVDTIVPSTTRTAMGRGRDRTRAMAGGSTSSSQSSHVASSDEEGIEDEDPIDRLAVWSAIAMQPLTMPNAPVAPRRQWQKETLEMACWTARRICKSRVSWLTANRCHQVKTKERFQMYSLSQSPSLLWNIQVLSSVVTRLKQPLEMLDDCALVHTCWALIHVMDQPCSRRIFQADEVHDLVSTILDRLEQSEQLSAPVQGAFLNCFTAGRSYLLQQRNVHSASDETTGNINIERVDGCDETAAEILLQVMPTTISTSMSNVSSSSPTRF